MQKRSPAEVLGVILRPERSPKALLIAAWPKAAPSQGNPRESKRVIGFDDLARVSRGFIANWAALARDLIKEGGGVLN